MRIIIAGSRDIPDPYTHVCEAIAKCIFVPKINLTIISGGARGIDRAGELFAQNHGFSCERYIPDWSLGKMAGILRNAQMIKEGKPDALIAVWDGVSRGTADMITKMTKHGGHIYVHIVGEY